jgi:hypothetical protein
MANGGEAFQYFEFFVVHTKSRCGDDRASSQHAQRAAIDPS